MNTEKIKTLDKVHDAIEIIENARSILGLSPDERMELERASVMLRNLERAIIRVISQDMIKALNKDAQALKDLSDQIKQSSDALSGVANALEKTSKIVESFINIIASAVAAGLL